VETVGRPTKCNGFNINMAKKLYRMGATDEDVANFLNVTPATIYAWKDERPEFLKATKEKANADEKVFMSLYKRACGYSHPDMDIKQFMGQVIVTPITKHYPPDTTACIFWLKNRQREKWRDEQVTNLLQINGVEADVVNNLRKIAGMDCKEIQDVQEVKTDATSKAEIPK
jgi:hypothetical protein